MSANYHDGAGRRYPAFKNAKAILHMKEIHGKEIRVWNSSRRWEETYDTLLPSEKSCRRCLRDFMYDLLYVQISRGGSTTGTVARAGC